MRLRSASRPVSKSSVRFPPSRTDDQPGGRRRVCLPFHGEKRWPVRKRVRVKARAGSPANGTQGATWFGKAVCCPEEQACSQRGNQSRSVGILDRAQKIRREEVRQAVCAWPEKMRIAKSLIGVSAGFAFFLYLTGYLLHSWWKEREHKDRGARS